MVLGNRDKWERCERENRSGVNEGREGGKRETEGIKEGKGRKNERNGEK